MFNLIEFLKQSFPNVITDDTYASLEKDLSIKADCIDIRKSNDIQNRISVEIIAEPESPDAHGQWYSKETIEKGMLSADKAWREGRLNMNLFHAYDDIDKSHVELIKHYIVPFDCTVNGESVKEGSWVGEVKWHNQELFEKRTIPSEDGTLEIAGLSLRGWGKVHSPKTDTLEKATTANVEKDDKGNLVYRGEKFVGYNKPMKDGGKKQGKVLAKKGDEIKLVRFGDPSMPDNQTEEANDAFYARFGGQDGLDDKFSPLYWSAKWLWARGDMKGKGAKDFYTLKS